ncbi:MAG: hypothetical protein KBT36_00285 [Kurthia sp.]|nr:hypothetical protein [Candidatus Kurthia equi]
MIKEQLHAQQILEEKQMADSYSVKEVHAYELPVAKHQASIYYKARFRYDILQRQTLQLLDASSDAIEQHQLENLLGVEESTLEEILQLLYQDGVIEIKNNLINLSQLGISSAEDGFSPMKSSQQHIEFMYEPVTSFVVKNPLHSSNTKDNNHPIVKSEGYKLDYCSSLDQSQIVVFYEELTGENLLEDKKNFQIEHIAHQASPTEFSVAIQELKLYQRKKTEIVHAIWNAMNKKIIHLA